ncbi:hypothetical protein O181_111473 [Austropuccinia psidii MF-1]|uniref:Uncharacterized protein n=1 Tax=Austropuccinia psidii MF-1 TaxID=1389203 RepID=A0A9Q3PRR3_9BASI|nr:hypothetical protein [Austropuccinia psidii MF-1]
MLHRVPTPPSRCDSNTATQFPLHPTSTAYNPYTPTAPSNLLMPPPTCLILSASYNPNTLAEPSKCTSDGALNPPYASFHLPNSLCRLPSLLSLRSRRPSDAAPISSPTNPYASAPPPFTILMLLHRPQPSLGLLPPSTYHPYALVVSSRHASNAAPTPA